MMENIHREWKIRLAQNADVDSLVAMRLRLDAHMAVANPRLLQLSAQGREALRDSYLQEIASTSSCVLVSEWRPTGVLIGMIFGRASIREDLVPTNIGRIDDVFVDPGRRRQGICRGLLKELLVFFERKGVEVLDLTYTIGNTEAENTWHGLGFQPVLTVANAKIGDLLMHLENTK
ncbi:MAG: GNAT family N-acetyltransferase [Pyrinomonadaceae bacterium]